MSQETPNYILKGDVGLIKKFLERTIEKDGRFFVPFIKEGMKILDLGCGPGGIACGIAKKIGSSGSIVGLDMDTQSLDFAKSHAQELGLTNIEFKEGRADQIPFEDESFDAVFMNAVLCHAFKFKDAIISEVKRVLKKGGLYALRDVDFSSNIIWPEIPTLKKLTAMSSLEEVSGVRERNFSVGKELKSILIHSGFEILHHQVDGDIRDTAANSHIFKVLPRLNSFDSKLSAEEFQKLQDQIEIEKQEFLNEPGRIATITWIGVVGKKPN